MNFNIKPYIPKHSPTTEGLPTVYYIETVLACNLKCPECVIGIDAVTRTKKILKFEEFKIISEKIKPYAKLVYLHKWGEPLMNKHIFDMISIVAEYAHAHISTNGLLLDKKKCEELIKSGVGTLIISIDGITQDVYEKYRIGGKVDKVIENIRYLKEFNNKYDNQTTILPQFIVFDHNYDQIDMFRKFCEQLELKAIFKKPYIRFGNTKESNDKNFQREKFLNKESHYKAISTCAHLDSIMTITADGRILVCAQDYNNDLYLGNILDKETTVQNLWMKEEYINFRNLALKQKNPPEICIKKCMIYNPGYKV
jgi:radical SAM protein with 4Fe4S-binding SPASM domain